MRFLSLYVISVRRARTVPPPWCSSVSAAGSERPCPALPCPAVTAPRFLHREPPPEGPRRPRRHPLRAGGLHQPAVLPHRGGQQQARPRREVPGAARLP
ncbi:hypothetical protein Nmel_015858 [Mimus melanotis]